MLRKAPKKFLSPAEKHIATFPENQGNFKLADKVQRVFKIYQSLENAPCQPAPF